MARTLFDKIWDPHVVARREDGRDLIYLDRHVLHELHAPEAFRRLQLSGRALRRPDLTFAVQDHTVASRAGRDDGTNPEGKPFIEAMRAGTTRLGIRLFDVADPQQGISHVVAPELGMVLPGSTYACPDSHAGTVGGLGAIGFACGTSELEHILATQTIAVVKPMQMRIRLDGVLQVATTAKDVALAVIRAIGVSGARGCAIEYAGAVVEAMGIEARLTLCNFSIEMGARTGLVAPDDAVYSWLAGRPYAPSGEAFEAAVETWRDLPTDASATFGREVVLDCTDLEPQVTWGTDPSQVVAITEFTPDPERAPEAERAKIERALNYMDLRPGAPVKGLPIGRVFIGSCTNSRLSDLELAASVVRGHRIARGVTGLVVPGSSSVKREAEALGLDVVFKDSGLHLGRSGVFDVRRRERRRWRVGGAVSVDDESELRGPPGTRCENAPRQPADGRRRSARG